VGLRLDLGVHAIDLRAVAHEARRAEAMGFGCLWSAETKHDPFLPLAVAAVNTERLQLGTSCQPISPRQSPACIRR